jgi:O-antigen ligase
MVLIGSRGALVAFVLGLVLMLIVMVFNRMLKLHVGVIGAFFVLILVAGVLFGERIYLRFFVSNSVESFGGRVELMQSAIDFAITNPLLGLGIGNFSPTVAGANLLFGPAGRPVHHVLLLWLAETGFPGAAFLLMCWGGTLVILLWVVFSSKISPSHIYLTVGIVGGIFGMVVHSQSDIVFRNAVIYCVYAVYLGLTGSIFLQMKALKRNPV